VAGSRLTVAVDPTYGLAVVTWIPRRIKHHHTTSTDQVDTETAGTAHTKYTWYSVHTNGCSSAHSLCMKTTHTEYKSLHQASHYPMQYGLLASIFIRLVGWEINVPFQHKIRLYWGQGLGWRFSSDRLRMANDTVISQPHFLFVERQPKMGKDRGGSFELLH